MSAVRCSAECLWRQMWIPPEHSKSIHHFLTAEEYLWELKTAVSTQPFPQRWKRAKLLGVVICGCFAGWTTNSQAEIHKSCISVWHSADNDMGWSGAPYCHPSQGCNGDEGALAWTSVCFAYSHIVLGSNTWRLAAVEWLRLLLGTFSFSRQQAHLISFHFSFPFSCA